MVRDPETAAMVVLATVTVPAAHALMAAWAIALTGEAVLVIVQPSRTVALAWGTQHSVLSARRWSTHSWP